MSFVTISSTICPPAFKIYLRNKGGSVKITSSGMLLDLVVTLVIWMSVPSVLNKGHLWLPGARVWLLFCT